MNRAAAASGLVAALLAAASSAVAAPPTAGEAAASAAATFALPPVCGERGSVSTSASEPAAATLQDLRARAERLIETDPAAAVDLLCAAIPRVERERGADSAEMAWWVASLGTPLIAFMERFDEAIPLLEYAQPILERHLGPHASEVAEIHVAYAWIAQRQGRNAESAAAWRRALAIRERNPGLRRIELQKVLVGLAQSEAILREFDSARTHLARAERILVANGEADSDAAAAIQNTYINIAWREEKFAEVRDRARLQIEIERRMASPAAQRVPAYAWVGLALERLDDFEAAEAALRTALEISESRDGAPLQRHTLVALTQLAGLLIARGRAAEALPFAQRAVEHAEQKRGPDAPVLVRPLQFVGEAHRALGQLPQALRSYRRASAIAAAAPSQVERTWLVAQHRGLARVHLQLGDVEAARLELAAAEREAGDDPQLAVERAWTLLALSAAEQAGEGASTAAPDRTAAAIGLLRSRLPETHPAILRALVERCRHEARASTGSTPNCDTAVERLATARDVDPLLRHDLHAVRSELARRRGDAAAAYEHAILALSAATTLGTPDPRWRAEFAVASRLRERDDLPLAIFFGKQAITHVEALRGEFIGEDRQLDRGFVHDKVPLYRAVADWLMEANRLDEGLAILRLLKLEEFHDFVLRDARSVAPATIFLTPAEQELRRQYRQALDEETNDGDEIDRLARLTESARISATERRRLEQLLAEGRRLEKARAERLARFVTHGAAPRGAPESGTRPVQARELARELGRLGPDTVLAVYVLTDTRLRILIATAQGEFEHETAIESRTVRTSIGRFLDAISRREDVRAPAAELYDLLVRPVDEAARRAGARRLVLWLDGALRYVPFAALSDGRGYLVDHYAIEHYASAMGAAAAPAGLRVRGLGVTRGVEGFGALPAMADELCDVVRGPIEGLAQPGRSCPRPGVGEGALEGIGYADAAFTAERLRSLLAAQRDFSVLHLGTHFSLRPGNASKSFLVLGDGQRLTLDAVSELDFSRLALVTLSACQSGMGGAGSDGREIDGLSGIVQRRGARHVVATLWRVEDGSTARVVKELYAGLATGDVAAALRRAQLATRAHRRGLARPYAHPFYWAGLFVSGAPAR